MEEVAVVRQSHLENIDMCPQDAALTSRGELLLLKAGAKITVNKLDPFVRDVFQIILHDDSSFAIWYLEGRDAILVLSRNQAMQTVLRLFVNWRIPSDKSGKCSLAPAKSIKPTKWVFPKLENDSFYSLELGVFERDANPRVEVCNNSICILSESVAIFWDIMDRPVLRLVLMMPLQMIRPLFSFQGDRLALITKDRLFVIKMVSDDFSESETEPFAPGSKCFDLQEQELRVDFGVLHGETRNFLFLARHLPERNIRIQILFQFQPPGHPLNVKFASKDVILLLTSAALLGCVRTRRENGSETYEPSQLNKFNHQNSKVLINRDFTVIHADDNLHFFPSAEKSKFDFGDGTFSALDVIKFRGVRCVIINDEFCVVINSSFENGAIYVLKFKDAEEIARMALQSSKLETRLSGIRVMSQDGPQYAKSTYRLGMELIKTKQKNTGLSLLIDAFNTNNGLTPDERKKVLAEVMALPQRMKNVFIERAQFKGDEIDDEILSRIATLPESKAALKLINARRFESMIKFENCAQAPLYMAVSYSIKGDHEQAKVEFARLKDLKTLKSLDLSLLSLISQDLTPQMLVKIGRPELENELWTVDERKAACYYYNEDIEKALSIAAQNLPCEWHFSEWPKVPLLCDWIDGNSMMKFAAGCLTEYDTKTCVAHAFQKLASAITAAKSSRFRDALEIMGDSIYKFDFLRAFAKTPNLWIAVINQIDDDDIKRYAIHHFIASSPKHEYYEAVSEAIKLPGLAEIAQQLEETDNKLIALVSVGSV